MLDRTIVFYADDTVPLAKDDKQLVAKIKMNAYLHTFSNWLTFNEMSLNISKKSVLLLVQLQK